MVDFTPDGDDFAVPVRTLGTHPNLFLFDPRPLWRLLGDGRWDLIDLHEEPFGLAVAEVLVLRALRARRHPVPGVLGPEPRQALPAALPVGRALVAADGAAGAYTCNAEAGRILRRKGLVGELELLPLGRGHRPLPSGRAPTARAAPAGRVRGAADPAQGRRRAAAGRGARRPARPRPLRRRSRRRAPSAALADELGLTDRVTFHGHVDEAALVEVFPTFDVLAVPSVHDGRLGRAVRPGRGGGTGLRGARGGE